MYDVVLFRELFIKFCKLGNDMLSDDAFHIIIFVSCSVSVQILMVGMGVVGRGNGCKYLLMFSRHRSASVINWFVRKVNLLWRVVGVGVVSWLKVSVDASICLFVLRLMLWLR